MENKEKEIREQIANALKDAIQNGTIVIEKGSKKLFDIILQSD